MKKNGFTLIELLITIGIMFILAAIAVPGYIGQQKRADRTEAYTNLDNIRLVEEQRFADTGCYAPLVAGACPVTPADIGATGSTLAIRNANFYALKTALARWGAPGTFVPGNAAATTTSMSYSYRIIYNNRITNANVPFNVANIAASTPCFVAIATAVDNTRVAGDIFAVDCNNNKNY